MKVLDYPRSGIRIHAGTTGAGLQVFVFPMEGFQSKYAFFAAKYGGCDRRFLLDGRWTDTPAGIAHYLEHKMFDMPGYNAMEHFAALGASPNAFTGSGMTGYLFSCTEHFDECLRELLTYVTTPYYTAESVQKEQGIIGQEIRMGEDDPSRRVRQNLMRALYREHPVRDSIAGTVEAIAQITPETLYDCHRMFYSPENMVLCCAGDLDPEAVMALAEELVPPGGSAPERDYGGEEGALPVSVRAQEKMAVSMPIFMQGSKLPWLADPAEWARQMLLANLSCDLLLGEGSPLYGELYSGGLINSSFYAGAFDFPRGGVCCAGGRCQDPVAVMGRITDAAESFRMDSSARARLDRLKRAALGNFLMALDSPEELCHTQAESWFGGWERMTFPALLDGLSPADAESFLREAFQAQRLALSVIQPI